MEQPHDLLLSTLNAYLQAIGGTARMIVSFADGHEPPSTSQPGPRGGLRAAQRSDVTASTGDRPGLHFPATTRA